MEFAALGRAQEFPRSVGSADGVQTPPDKYLVTRHYATLAAYSVETHQDSHSVLLDYDIFQHVPMLDAKDLKTVQKLYDAKDLDFRLKPGLGGGGQGRGDPQCHRRL